MVFVWVYAGYSPKCLYRAMGKKNINDKLKKNSLNEHEIKKWNPLKDSNKHLYITT